MSTILCVDDDGGILAAVKNILDSEGYNVLITTNPTLAPSCIKFQNIDLILLDINMPKKNGFEIYEEIQALKSIPVLFVSGDPQLFHERTKELWIKDPEKYNPSCFHLLAKPFQMNKLIQKIEDILSANEVMK